MLDLSSDIIGAGTALAGLVLVFLGSISTGFDGYQPQEQRSVVRKYRRRAWGAYTVFVLALGAALSGLFAKLTGAACVAAVGLVLLVLSFLAVVILGLFEAREIK